jgi:hypothetical protein
VAVEGAISAITTAGAIMTSIIHILGKSLTSIERKQNEDGKITIINYNIFLKFNR